MSGIFEALRVSQVTISLRRDPSPGLPAGTGGLDRSYGSADLDYTPGGSAGVGNGAGRRRSRTPGLPPLGAKITGRRGKRGGSIGPAAADPASQQRWHALSRVVSDGSFSPSASDQPSMTLPGGQLPALPSAAQPGLAVSQPESGPAVRSITNAAVEQQQADVSMADGDQPPVDEPMADGGAPQGSRSSNSKPPNVSPFACAPPAHDSSSASDTESEEDAPAAAQAAAAAAAVPRGNVPVQQQQQQSKMREGGPEDTDAAAAARPTKKPRSNLGGFSATRAASLNTVLAAVEERTARQGSGAMDAAVGCAPTTVEDCLQSSSFGIVRKVCIALCRFRCRSGGLQYEMLTAEAVAPFIDLLCDALQNFTECSFSTLTTKVQHGPATEVPMSCRDSC